MSHYDKQIRELTSANYLGFEMNTYHDYSYIKKGNKAYNISKC